MVQAWLGFRRHRSFDRDESGSEHTDREGRRDSTAMRTAAAPPIEPLGKPPRRTAPKRTRHSLTVAYVTIRPIPRLGKHVYRGPSTRFDPRWQPPRRNPYSRIPGAELRRGAWGGQADDSDGRRRSCCLAGDHARPAPAVRRRIPDRPRDVGRRGDHRSDRVRVARSPGRADRVRSADAGHDRRRVPRSGPRHARRQARVADGVRRHRRRDQGDQRHRPRLLPAQAVGSARGAACIPSSTTC